MVTATRTLYPRVRRQWSEPSLLWKACGFCLLLTATKRWQRGGCVGLQPLATVSNFAGLLHFPEGGGRTQLPGSPTAEPRRIQTPHPVARFWLSPLKKPTISSGKGQLKSDRTAQSQQGKWPLQKLSLQCRFIIHDCLAPTHQIIWGTGSMHSLLCPPPTKFSKSQLTLASVSLSSTSSRV